MTVPLRACGICLSFGDKAVLHDVDFAVEAGEVLSLIGPNGAGKSSLLAVLAGDITPDGGSVELFGQPLASLNMKARAKLRSVLEQRPTVGFAYRVGEVVRMGRTPWQGTDASDDDDQVVLESMQRVEVEHLEHRDVLSLSGGESSRMSIARVLAQRTPLVFLDEPAAALDVRHQESVMRLARELAAAGSSVVVVSHDLDAAAHWSDRVALMEAGHILALGPPAEVLSGELLSSVYQTPIEMFRHPNTGRTIVRPVR